MSITVKAWGNLVLDMKCGHLCSDKYFIVLLMMGVSTYLFTKVPNFCLTLRDRFPQSSNCHIWQSLLDLLIVDSFTEKQTPTLEDDP